MTKKQNTTEAYFCSLDPEEPGASDLNSDRKSG